MHGAIFMELNRFVVGALGEEFWRRMLDSASLSSRVYLPLATYPDEEAVALIGAASELSGKSGNELLAAFGEHLSTGLLDTYGALLRREWRTLDVLEHAESTIHRVVRQREPDASPPRLQCKRVTETEVEVTYDSARRLCALAEGLGLGIARHYGEELAIEHDPCMLRGAKSCVMRFRLVASS